MSLMSRMSSCMHEQAEQTDACVHDALGVLVHLLLRTRVFMFVCRTSILPVCARARPTAT